MWVATLHVNAAVALAGDSVWRDDTDEARTAGTLVNVTDITLTVEEDDEDDELYVYVTVEHDNDWTIYTDSGFEAAITQLVREWTGLDVEIGFTEQGQQDFELADMETQGGSDGDAALARWVMKHGVDSDD